MSALGFHGPELRGKPGGRCSEGNRAGFNWGEGVEDGLQVVVVDVDQIIRVGECVWNENIVNFGGEGVRVDVL